VRSLIAARQSMSKLSAAADATAKVASFSTTTSISRGVYGTDTRKRVGSCSAPGKAQNILEYFRPRHLKPS
jgi:hypothetical protein